MRPGQVRPGIQGAALEPGVLHLASMRPGQVRPGILYPAAVRIPAPQ